MFFKFLSRKAKYLNNFNHSRGDIPPENEDGGESRFKTQLKDNLNTVISILGNGSDVKLHEFVFGREKNMSGALVFIDGLANNERISQAILKPIMNWQTVENGRELKGQELLQAVKDEVLYTGDIETNNSIEELAEGCLQGDTLLLLEGCDAGLIISSKGWEKRSITEPQSETVVRGPREGFTENLRTNTSLIRRKIRNGKLHIEHLKVGRKTHTDICLIYLDGVCDPKVLEELKSRINGISVDSILESGYIEEYIEDAPFSPFSTVGYTEKPDVVAAKILEGRIGIVVDGTPFVLTVPMLFIESFQTSEDYYIRSFYASMLRVLRYIGYIIAVFAPAIYVALTSFHQELIPTTLLFTIANAREGTPFPVFIETSIMVFSFEVLREAGIRLPRPVGQAISIVGALVMGDAAVSAGIVGAPVVITIAITAVSSFLVPSQNDSGSILRIVMLILAGFLGWYGISMGFLAVLVHLASLESFGVTYFDGFSWTRDLQDSVIRMPLWSMTKRPKNIARGDTVRRRFFIPPARPFASKEDDIRKGKQ